MTHPLTVALAYAAHGWRVHPLRPCSKLPASPHGCHDGTTDAGVIHRWWEARPNCNIGIATGAGSNLVVVDLDGPTALSVLEALDIDPEATLSQQTGRAEGGRQLFYLHPGVQIRNQTNFRPGVDIRGDGGYVVVPPSIHPDTGQRYRWLSKLPPTPLPPRLLRALTAPVPPPASLRPPRLDLVTADGTRYALRALDAECAEVAATGTGGRNHRLNKAAFKLGGLVGAGHLSESLASARLLEAGLAAGLSEREATYAVRSGLRAGMARPRSVG